MIFTNAYACAANCAPSRACLLSGQYTPRHRIFNVGTGPRGNVKHRKLLHVPGVATLDSRVKTWAHCLQEAGYTTATMGKWHLSKDPLPYGVPTFAYTDPPGFAALDVEPGDYQVYVSRGSEYSLWTAPITITGGETTVLDAAIARVLDTTGFVSSDYHVHLINSPDSRISRSVGTSVRSARALALQLRRRCSPRSISPWQIARNRSRWVASVRVSSSNMISLIEGNLSRTYSISSTTLPMLLNRTFLPLKTWGYTQ